MALTLEKVREMYPGAKVQWESCGLFSDLFVSLLTGCSCTTGRFEVDLDKNGQVDFYVEDTMMGLHTITQAKK